MRLFLGFLVLACLFAMAASWQRGLTADLVREREGLRGTLVVDEASAGWSTLVLGRPSGAQPFAAPDDTRPRPKRGARPRRDATSSGTETPEAATEDPWRSAPPARDAEHVVRAGEALGVIVQRHYEGQRPEGVSLPDLVATVATYNGLASPDDIRVDTIVRLPHPARFVR